jgi:SAM-dependent methyltransferase
VGCGIGNLTRLILEEPHVTAVHGIDIDPAYVARVLSALPDSRLTASTAAAERFLPSTGEAAEDASYDCVVCSNVLEHVEDHVQAMRNFHRLLAPEGRVLILVPAHRFLFCDLDRNLSHFRRYTPAELTTLQEESGLELIRFRHFNPLGVIGWWLNGKVLRRKTLPPGQVRLYSKFAISLSAMLDKINIFPFGISLLALFRRPA